MWIIFRRIFTLICMDKKMEISSGPTFEIVRVWDSLSCALSSWIEHVTNVSRLRWSYTHRGKIVSSSRTARIISSPPPVHGFSRRLAAPGGRSRPSTSNPGLLAIDINDVSIHRYNVANYSDSTATFIVLYRVYPLPPLLIFIARWPPLYRC